MIPFRTLIVGSLHFQCPLFLRRVILILTILFSLTKLSAQPACTPSPTFNCEDVTTGSVYLMASAANIDMTFDSFGKFISGITVNGATLLRLTVAEVAAPVTPCRWQLHANIDNSAFLATNTIWEQIYDYGTPGPPYPTIDKMQIRVRNACNTSLTGAGFANILNTTQSIDIVESPGVSNNPGIPGVCPGTNVNRPGSYLTNYGEYAFAIDYRVLPTTTFMPGIYQLTIRFCLSEDM